jgi:hypothetical protein
MFRPAAIAAKKQAEKKLHHLEIHPAQDHRYVVEHHMHDGEGFSNGPAQKYALNEDELAAHMAEHAPTLHNMQEGKTSATAGHSKADESAA